MKLLIQISVLLVAFGASSAGIPNLPVPQVTVGVSTDSGGIGLEPVLKWYSSRSVGAYDLEGGVDAVLDENNKLPFTVWGKATRGLRGYDVSVRGAMRSRDPGNLALSIRGDGPTTVVQVDGTAGSTFSIGKVQVKKVLERYGGSWLIHPSFNVRANTCDVSVAYAMDKTAVKVDANNNVQRLTVSRVVGSKNRITPSITTRGKVSVDVARDLDDLGTIATELQREAIDLKWHKGPSTVKVHAPLDGGGLKVKFNRRVDF